MHRTLLRTGTIALAAILAAMLAAGPALADKPNSWGGQGKGAKHEQKERHGRDEDYGHGAKSRVDLHGYFGDRERHAAREYYEERFRSGHCPPGLRKKHNGCMPPGQAKKWAVGRRLPRDVTFYDVPPRLVVELGRPPSGYRYVRVASDILLIAAGTGMVVDAIEDLSRR